MISLSVSPATGFAYPHLVYGQGDHGIINTKSSTPSDETPWQQLMVFNYVLFCKFPKTKGGFANENSSLKLLYAGILKATERWTHPIQNWSLTLSQLTIHFPDRLEK